MKYIITIIIILICNIGYGHELPEGNSAYDQLFEIYKSQKKVEYILPVPEYIPEDRIGTMTGSLCDGCKELAKEIDKINKTLDEIKNNGLGKLKTKDLYILKKLAESLQEKDS